MKVDRKVRDGMRSYVQIYYSTEPEDMPVPVQTEQVIQWAAEITLQEESFSYPAELSVTLCNGAYIRTLNASYRHKDSETDVLSFPLFESEEEDPLEEECIPLGDMVLNLDRAAVQAEELGHSTLREIAFLTVHSVLHLLGYDHERSAEDEELMCARQRCIMEKIEKKMQEQGNEQ